MFSKNSTLTSISLWRCGLGTESGAALSRGMESNHKITFLEVGHNGLAMADQLSVKSALEKNFKRLEKWQKLCRNEKNIADKVLAEEIALQEQLRAERHLREWLEDQKQLRGEERRKTEEKRYVAPPCVL